jgi:hypothetical protein
MNAGIEAWIKAAFVLYAIGACLYLLVKFWVLCDDVKAIRRMLEEDRAGGAKSGGDV